LSEFLTDVRDELKALIISTISEANANNVYMSIAAARMNLVERIANNRLTLPIWVLDASSVVADPEWGVDAESYRCPVTIVEIRAADSTDVQATIQDSLANLQRAIYAPNRTNFQAIERGRIDASVDAPAVDALLEAQLNAVAGMLIYSPGLLCGVFDN
jgi:hypothetical protein